MVFNESHRSHKLSKYSVEYNHYYVMTIYLMLHYYTYYIKLKISYRLKSYFKTKR